MLVSWSWLKRYVDLPITPAELGQRFAMSGLNLESIDEFEGDPLIDLEVTSNRGDCLGHLGVAREAAVLLDQSFNKPNPTPPEKGASISGLLSLENRFAEACPRYTARLIRGVRVGPSPAWLAKAVRSMGAGVVNNVVDVTNFVLFECGQPLHAFDYGKISGQKIIIRPANAGETIEAIDHRQYQLLPTDCVIADATRPVAIAGVMGGATTEVTESTRDVLLEVADFAPLSIRRTARRLKLQSPSSFRFERRVDPQGLDWASRRACELIMEVAGGELASGFVQSHPVPAERPPFVFRLSQIQRVLGMTIPDEVVSKILRALGCRIDAGKTPSTLSIAAPSWRHDLTREIDLVEEVARIHGYDKIPDDSPISVVASRRRPVDAAMEKVRGVFSAAGFCEAMTPSLVPQALDPVYSPWTELPSLESITPMLEGAKNLRRSIVPSLLHSRYANQAASGLNADLYEAAHVYLPGNEADSLPREMNTLALVSGKDFYAVKGLVERIVHVLGIDAAITLKPHAAELLDEDLAVELSLDGAQLGFIGTLSRASQKKLKLDQAATVAELNLDALYARLRLVPQHRPISTFPAVSRDINLIVDESLQWANLSSSVRTAAGPLLVDLRYVETYRDPNKDGTGKMRVLMNLQLQSPDSTLAGAEADAVVQSVVKKCEQEFGAKLLA